jgi:N-acetylmuramic acid 6-phosphate etherase
VKDVWARLPTEKVSPRPLDTMRPEALVALLCGAEAESVRAARGAAPRIARAAVWAGDAIAAGGRLIYVGAGTSGRLCALEAAESPPTFGSDRVVAVVAGGARSLRRSVEGAEDRAADAERALARLRVGPGDVVVGVAASGVTPFVRAALRAARAAGARTALVTASPVRGGADAVIVLPVGPEVLAGSTRLKAGTATKIALNALTTAAMVRAGKCYGPFMVDVAGTSAKLRARQRRIVSALCPGDPAGLLRRAGGSVKMAVVMGKLGVTRARAEQLLAAAGGRLRKVIG